MTDGTIITVDTETTMQNKVGNNKASAFCPDNYIVMYGAKRHDYTSPVTTKKYEGKQEKDQYNIDRQNENNMKVMAGQNLKFDLHHFRKNDFIIGGQPCIEWLKDHKVWDTQLAEYILTGQETKYASLDNMAVKYGLPVKDSQVKEAFEKGIGADGIEEKTLSTYLKQDLSNTEAVALAQMNQAYTEGKLPLIEAMNDALLAITDIEYNGLALNLPLLNKNKYNLMVEETVLESYIKKDIETLIPNLKGQPFNIDSNKQLSSILFGGDVEFEIKVPYTTKNGKTRNKIIKQVISLSGIVDGKLFSTPNANGFKIDEEILSNINRHVSTTPTLYNWRSVIDDILKRKKIIKELNTYYNSLSELIFPDGLLHPNINMCATDTGRTSSSEPNGQNIPSGEDSDVKKLFISRWGEDGRIIKADYKQIEIIALAYLSKDPVLFDDIFNGRDIHEEIGKGYYGSIHKITDDERRVIKTVNFGLIYGGTANALALQAGIPVSDVKKIIYTFYDRYKEVRIWQALNLKRVAASRVHTAGSTTKAGMPSAIGQLESPTGRVYIFHEKDNPYKPGEVNFKPTEIKNYPVQGFATGDLVLTMLGVLWRVLRNNKDLVDKCLMVNLVHDEIVFDCHVSIIKEAMHFIKRILEDTPKYLKEIYNINLGLPTKVKVTCGENWKEQLILAV